MWTQYHAEMRTVAIGLALTATLLSLPISGSAAFGAGAHPNYPLGKAKSCKLNYVKRAARHVVKGKEVRYVECVYVTPIPGVPQYSVSVDALSPTADGWPIGDALTVSALVTDPNNPTTAPTGTVTFSSNGAPVTSCNMESLVANEFNQPGFGAYLSAANCTLYFSTTGIVTVTADVAEASGAQDIGTLSVYVVP
jgi:hypothetical protein